MNKIGPMAEITVKNAQKITGVSESSTRKVLNSLANKGYLIINKDSKRYIYVLVNHMLV